jgi:uncharacterized protein YdaU (DUF1376 family)
VAVNYYEHHLGDYSKDVGALPLAQEGAYRRLLDRYYATEKPLPGTLADCCEIVVTRNKGEVDAVRTVLVKFFHLEPDGLYHQKRADLEIARYRGLEPQREQERELKQANTQNRLRKHRDERAELFQILTRSGQHVAWNCAIADLRKRVSALQVPRPATAPETQPATAPATFHETGTATAETATHSPYPTPIPEIQLASLAARATAGEACKAMRTAGLADVSPSHPALIAMVEQGATLGEFATAAAKALRAGKGFGYALGIVKGDREDAARMTLAPSSKTHGLARFALPPGAPRVLPDDLPDLDLEDGSETNDVDAHRARG